jgi:hypothetical protein
MALICVSFMTNDTGRHQTFIGLSLCENIVCNLHEMGGPLKGFGWHVRCKRKRT